MTKKQRQELARALFGIADACEELVREFRGMTDDPAALKELDATLARMKTRKARDGQRQRAEVTA